MSEPETALHSAERLVLNTSCFTDSFLAAIDNEGRFYVLGTDHEGRAIFVTFSPDGDLDQERVLTAHQTDTFGIDSSRVWEADYWEDLHESHNLFKTRANLYFGNAGRPPVYRETQTSSYLMTGKFDLDELKAINNPFLSVRSAQQMLKNLRPISPGDERLILQNLHANTSLKDCQAIEGVYADVPKAWAALSEHLWLVLRDFRILVSCSAARRLTVVMVRPEAVFEADTHSFVWGNLPTTGIEWLFGASMLYHANGRLLSCGGIQNEHYDLVVRRIEWNEEIMRESLGDHSRRHAIPAVVTYGVAPYLYDFSESTYWDRIMNWFR